MSIAGRKKRMKKIINIVPLLVVFVLIYFATYYLAARGLIIFGRKNLWAWTSQSPTSGQIENKDQSPDKSQSQGQDNRETIISESLATRVGVGAAPLATPQASLTFGSFSEYFIGTDQVDWSRTTLYRDHKAVAIFFAPDFSWSKADQALVDKFQDSYQDSHLNSAEGNYYDKRCLKKDCLEVKNLDLFYKGQTLVRPPELAKREVVAVSLGTIGENWLVGFTLKKDNKYQGLVFYFDGHKFSRLNIPEFNSDYSGLFGFGGVKNDFLVVYGAYKGEAYRVRPNQTKDISRFFEIKVMTKGFKPEIIRAFNGKDIHWYVYSATLSRPWLIKLWQNGTPEIVGEAVFDNFFSFTSESAIFKLVESNLSETILLAKVKENNQEIWQVFRDRGFKNENPAELISAPIARFDAAPFIIEKIARSSLSIDSPSSALVKLWFSSDGDVWRQLSSTDNLNFITPVTRKFFLQVTFPKFKDKFYSPFLEAVLFDYYYKIKVD
ncbi:MAG: hypothetical protein WC863_01080 [Patescibacteria group bacterium]